MEIRRYEKTLPEAAMQIREAVFCREQGFIDEFDEIDGTATHLLLLSDGEPVGTCRVFKKDGGYFLGRLAVLREFRARGCGRELLLAAEDVVREKGGESLRLHSQLQAKGFYEAVGYVAASDADEEQGCPHVWMEKALPEAAV